MAEYINKKEIYGRFFNGGSGVVRIHVSDIDMLPSADVVSAEEFALLEAKNEVLGQENDRLKVEIKRLHRENFWLTSEREPGLRWIAMADKLPPEDGSYIVCTKLGAVCTATFNVKLGRWGHSMYGVTHWMPLPKAPGEEG